MSPISYQNWVAEQEGEPSQYAIEYTLFTDAHITGEIKEGYGPYQLFNTVPISPSNTLTAAIIL